MPFLVDCNRFNSILLDYYVVDPCVPRLVYLCRHCLSFWWFALPYRQASEDGFIVVIVNPDIIGSVGRSAGKVTISSCHPVRDGRIRNRVSRHPPTIALSPLLFISTRLCTREWRHFPLFRSQKSQIARPSYVFTNIQMFLSVYNFLSAN
jgi:hypothetical protein